LLVFRLRLVQGAFERTGIDAEKDVALADHLAIGELHLVEVATDAGAHVDRFYGIKAAGVFVPLDRWPLDRIADRDLGGLGAFGWPARAFACRLAG
jgi:hypothetical protein